VIGIRPVIERTDLGVTAAGVQGAGLKQIVTGVQTQRPESVRRCLVLKFGHQV
jgi:hypothetical protein